MKVNDPTSAIKEYSQVAQQFSNSGFDAKAVAIYKQILKVDAECLDARIKLGDHFQRMGLASEALRELQGAVQTCQERGLKREAFDLLKRIAQLDPSNVPNRLSLADLLAREGLKDESLQEFTKLLEQVEGQGASDMVVRVCEQMFACFPATEASLRTYALAQVKLGAASAAIIKVKSALPEYPDSIALREALVAAYDALGDVKGAQSMYREIAEIYKLRGNHDGARDILQRFVPVDVIGGEEPDSSPSLILAELAPSDATPLNPRTATNVKLGAKPAPSAVSLDDLLAQARVALDFESLGEARECAERALEHNPKLAAAREILVEVARREAVASGKAVPEPVEEAEFELEPQTPPGQMAMRDDAIELDLSDDSDEIELEHTSLASAGDADTLDDSESDTLPDIELVLSDSEDPTESGFHSIDPPPEVEAVVMEMAEVAPEVETGTVDEFEIDLDDLDLGTDDDAAAEEPKGSSSSFAAQSSWMNARNEEAEAAFASGDHAEAERLYRLILEQNPNHPQAMLRMGEIAAQRGEDPSAEAADFGSDAFSETFVDESGTEDGDGDESVEESFDVDLDFEADLAVPKSAVAKPAVAKPAPAAAPKKAAPAPAKPAPAPVAAKPAPAPAAKPAPPAAKPAPAVAKPAPAPAAKPVPAAAKPAPAPAAKPAPAVAKPAPAPAAKPAPAVAKPAPAAPAKPAHAPAAKAASGPKAIEDFSSLFSDEEAAPAAAPEAAEPEVVLDAGAFAALIEEVEEEVEDEDAFDLAAALDEGTEDGHREGVAFEDVLRAFKKGIEEQIGNEEAGAHYDLAIAYKEMGLLTEAVEQLEKVRNHGELPIEGVSLLATCKLELGQAGEAAELLLVAVEKATPGPTLVALRYDLGEALLATDRRADALTAYQQVAAEDPGFRDVGQRIAELSK